MTVCANRRVVDSGECARVGGPSSVSRSRWDDADFRTSVDEKTSVGVCIMYVNRRLLGGPGIPVAASVRLWSFPNCMVLGTFLQVRRICCDTSRGPELQRGSLCGQEYGDAKCCENVAGDGRVVRGRPRGRRGEILLPLVAEPPLMCQ